MEKPTHKDIGKQVDVISNKLMEEFWQHLEECQRENPELTDKHIIFEGWAIQKIAGLHHVALNLVKRVSELESRRKKR